MKNISSKSYLLLISFGIIIVGAVVFGTAFIQQPLTNAKLLTDKNQMMQHKEQQYTPPFLNKGWLRDIYLDLSTNDNDFVMNKTIFFRMSAEITRPVKQFTVNIFNEQDKFYFVSPPVQQLNYPTNTVYRFSYPGEMYTFDLKPNLPFSCTTNPNDSQVDNQNDPCLFSYSSESANTTFTAPGNYYVNFVVLQENNMPLNYTAQIPIFNLPSQRDMDTKDTIDSIQQNINQTSFQTLEKIDSNDRKSVLMIIGSLIITVGLGMFAIASSKRDIFSLRKQETDYKKIQDERIRVLFQLETVKNDLRSFPSVVNDPDLASLEGDLQKKQKDLEEKLRILDEQISKFY